MSHWYLDPRYAAGAVADAFATLESVFSLSGERVADDSLCHVLRVNIDDQRYYVKRYVGSGKTSGGAGSACPWLGAPRVRSEWRNLLAFRSWGIPTATLVAYGLERRAGAFVRGALITAEIPDTMDLDRIAQDGDPRLRDRRWATAVSRQLATIARTLHAAGFAHNDLKWRNLLVDSQPVPTVYLIDCPSGAFYRGAVLDYRRIKDLACLDKVAKHHLSRSQRLRFYLDYMQRQRPSDDDRKRIARIVGFFDGRE